jgi:hypothetical protein
LRDLLLWVKGVKRGGRVSLKYDEVARFSGDIMGEGRKGMDGTV